MNREQAKALLPIITAFAEGKEVQFLTSTHEWHKDKLENISFQYEPERYRIKPEPLKVWINVHKGSSWSLYTTSWRNEAQAKEAASQSVNCVGTYPTEIEL